MRKLRILILYVFSIVILTGSINAKINGFLDLEAGPVFVGSNTIQVPNPEGTRFSLTDGFDVEGKVYYRLRLGIDLGRRHHISALFAPLTVNATGISADDIAFQDIVFPANQTVDGLYRFNSYRLTYRTLLMGRKKIDLWIGFTAKIRDAEIRLTSGNLEDSTTNVGFVPLVNLWLDWRFGDGWGLIFEADAAAAKQGRAEDVSLSVYRDLGKTFRIRAGYRLVEGGADVESVYNFAFLHYVYGAVQLRF